MITRTGSSLAALEAHIRWRTENRSGIRQQLVKMNLPYLLWRHNLRILFALCAVSFFMAGVFSRPIIGKIIPPPRNRDFSMNDTIRLARSVRPDFVRGQPDRSWALV